MTTNNSFNPERLDFARKRRGLTKRQLAESVGISPKTLNRYESLKNVPDEAMLASLSNVLEFPESFFLKSDIEIPPIGGISFRSLSTLSAKVRDRAVAAGGIGLEFATAWMDRRYNLPQVSIPRFPLGTMEPEFAAMGIRDMWGLGQRPISNMIHLLESKGVRVFSLAEDARSVDAFSFWHDNTPFVFLNTKKTAERSRMDAAHELGHLVLHSQTSPQKNRRVEEEAHAFGSAFLMPHDGFIASVTRNATIDQMIVDKKRWKVSLAALAYRMHKTGMLSKHYYKMAFVEIGRRGYRTNEPDSIPRETSKLLGMVFALARQKGITIHDIAEELAVYPNDLADLFFGLAPMPVPVTGQPNVLSHNAERISHSRPVSHPPLTSLSGGLATSDDRCK